MNKESAPDELVKAVAKVLGGGRYVSPRLAESLAVDLTRPTHRSPHEILSDREFEILRRLGSGKTVAQIADELNVSATTVSTYRSTAVGKDAHDDDCGTDPLRARKPSRRMDGPPHTAGSTSTS